MKMRHRQLLKQRIAKYRWVLNHYKKSMAKVGDALVRAFDLAAKAAEGFSDALKETFKRVFRKMPDLTAHRAVGMPYYRRHIRIPTWHR